MPHHVVLSESFADLVLARRWTILALVSLSAVLCTIVAAWTPVRTSITQGFLPNDEQFEEYRRTAQALGGSADDVILLATDERESLFEPSTLDAVRSAARDIEELAEVDRVDVFVDAPWLASNRRLSKLEDLARGQIRQLVLAGRQLDFGDTKPPLYWPQTRADQEQVDLTALREALTRLDPLVGSMISRRGTAQTMIVRLAEDAPKQGSAPTRLARRLKEIVKETGLGRGGIYAAGVLVTEGGMLREVRRSAWQLGPLGILIVCLLVYAVFRRVRLVGLTLAIALVATAWSVGAVSLVFGRITLLVAAAPLLITVISTSDTIHMASAYLAELDRGSSRRQAIRRSVSDVGGACVLTSVTTFVGFLSLMVVPAASLRHFSLSIAIGVAGALLLALTLCPIAFSMIDLQQQRPVPGLSLVNTGIAKFVHSCRWLSLRHPRVVTAVHVLVFAASLYLVSTMTMDADLPRRFPKAHGVRSGVEFFNREFDGANSIELYFRGDEQALTSPEFVTALSRIERRVVQEPSVRKAISIATLIETMDALLEIPEQQPLTQQRLAATMAILRGSDAAGVRSMLSPADGLARMTLQITLTRVFEIERLARQMADVCRQELPPAVTVEVTGAYPILGAAAQTIIQAQYQGFTICFLSVMTLVGLGLRSFRMALLAVVPNLMPLALLGGLLWLTSDLIDPDILGVAIVSFGLAVDDTIHFLHRYDIELGKSGSVLDALAQTFDYTGFAIVRTTVILGMGLSVFSLSGYLSVWFMGSYMVFVLAGAVLGDLLLLPSIILLFDGRSASDEVIA